MLQPSWMFFSPFLAYVRKKQLSLWRNNQRTSCFMNSSAKEPGYVYILTNPSFREDWVKIGKSSRPVDVRSKELDNTAVPLPFEIYATMRTTKYNEAERLVHRYIERFTNLRIRNNREFFNVKPEEALEIFRDVALVLEDAVIDEVHRREIIEDSAENIVTATTPAKTPKRSKKWTWLVPCNFKFFDIPACLKRFGEIYWMQYVNYQTGDKIYLYVSAPDSCIRYSFEVIGHDLPFTPVLEREIEFNSYRGDIEEQKRHNRFALFRLTGETHSSRLRLSNLIDNGLKIPPRGSLKLSNPGYHDLLKYIEDNF